MKRPRAGMASRPLETPPASRRPLSRTDPAISTGLTDLVQDLGETHYLDQRGVQPEDLQRLFVALVGGAGAGVGDDLDRDAGVGGGHRRGQHAAVGRYPGAHKLPGLPLSPLALSPPALWPPPSRPASSGPHLLKVVASSVGPGWSANSSTSS